MSGAWTVGHGIGQPAGECTPPLKKPSNVVKMGLRGEIDELNTIADCLIEIAVTNREANPNNLYSYDTGIALPKG